MVTFSNCFILAPALNFVLKIRTCPKRNSMTLLPKVAASGTEPETRSLESVSLSSPSLIFLIK
ncbi:hypothetical protein BWD12_08785 [Leptospira santarosai serovar Bananal]|uniref:Lipoprotein n=1 Tax=Leptospira santarosai TaxID=28183 RepID=A0AB73MBQ9_9LEPT|nr:hypothetical protein BWD11_14975 [Leptospira santarosai serovar Grippotyphosa]ONF79350.1 hypothetical protein BWD12_08785 [Leptospira santarosai serovar Bananal]ONF85231.1 hypothetical protein BWD13_14425 [Leptospira santarosai serovar Grippotyphosa]ONF94166.1 hypothetical protein BWD14_02425 [Leptospira santarosai]